MNVTSAIQRLGAALGVLALTSMAWCAPASAQTPAGNTLSSSERVAGADRYDTSAGISRQVAQTGGTVIIASGQNFPDALSGGAAAGSLDGVPVLLVRTNEVPPAISAELDRLRPTRILVLGGESAVSASVAQKLRERGAAVERLSGADRYETAAKVSAHVHGAGAATVYVASGQNYPDALAGGPAAGRAKAPILLTRTGELPASTLAELKRLRPTTIVVLGGQAAVSQAVVDQLGAVSPTARVSGEDRYRTAAALSKESFTRSDTVYLVNGENYPDALSGTPLAASSAAPILLASNTSARNAPVCAEIARLGATRAVVLGGPNALSDAAVADISKGCPPVRSWPAVEGVPGGALAVNGEFVGRWRGGTAGFLALMGTPDERTESAMCYRYPLKHTVYRWGDLTVIVPEEDDEDSLYGFSYPAGEIGGWVIDPRADGQAGLTGPFTGPEGITIGTPLSTLRATFTEAEWDYAGVEGTTFEIFVGDTHGASFDLDANQRVTRMAAGYTCGR